MGFQQLDNCPRCGRVFVRSRSICPDCFRKQEEDLLKVKSYLHKNPGCNMQELSEQTYVSVAQIREFILAERIMLTNIKNLEYPCESCGSLITKGRVCSECSHTINQLAAEMMNKEKATNQEVRRSTAYRSHSSENNLRKT